MARPRTALSVVMVLGRIPRNVNARLVQNLGEVFYAMVRWADFELFRAQHGCDFVHSAVCFGYVAPN